MIIEFKSHIEAFEALYFEIQSLIGDERANDNKDVIKELARHIANESECRHEAQMFVRDLEEVENGTY